MEFYFCERCGKRVTNSDLNSGRGKDKKVRGVYCKDCEAGVHTIEFEPIRLPAMPSKQDEVYVPSQEATAPNAGRRHARNHFEASSARSPTSDPELGVVSPRKHHRTDLAPPPKASLVPYVVGGLGAVLVMLTLALAMRNSSGAPTVRETAGSEKATPKSLMPRSPSAQQQTTPAVASPKLQPAGSEPDTTGDGARTSLAPPVEASKPVAGTPVHEASPTPPDIPNPTRDPDTAETSAPAVPALIETPAKIGTVAPNLEQPVKAKLTEILQTLAHKGLDEAISEIAARQAEYPGIAGALQAVKREDARFIERLRGRIGHTVKLPENGTLVTGTLVEVESQFAQLETDIFIQGKKAGATVRRVPLSQACAAGREELLGAASNSESTWLGLTLTLLAAGRFDAARTALMHCGDLSLKPVLTELIETRESDVREKTAQSEWEVLESGAARVEGPVQAKSVLLAISSYEERNGQAAWAKQEDVLRRIEALRTRCTLLARGPEYALPGFFHGKVSRFDAKTLSLTVQYDFKEEEQLADFTWATDTSKDAVKVTPKGLLVNSSGKGEHALRLLQFVSQDVRVSIAFGSRKNDNFKVSFAGDPDSRSKDSYFMLGTGMNGAYVYRVEGDKAPVQLHFTPWSAQNPLTGNGQLDFAWGSEGLSVALNGKAHLNWKSPPSPDQAGVAIGVGAATTLEITLLTITGRLHLDWIRQKLRRGR